MIFLFEHTVTQSDTTVYTKKGGSRLDPVHAKYPIFLFTAGERNLVTGYVGIRDIEAPLIYTFTHLLSSGVFSAREA